MTNTFIDVIIVNVIEIKNKKGGKIVMKNWSYSNEYFTGRKNKQLCDSLKNGYKEMAAINLELADSCLEADNQCLLDYEEKLSECE